MKYTFKGFKRNLDENTTTVEAENEEEARHLAMCKRWGPLPDPKLGIFFKYKGLGLDLI